MVKVINCSKKELDDFKSHFDQLYNHKSHYDSIKIGDYLPANINDLIKHSDKINRLLTKIKDNAVKQ